MAKKLLFSAIILRVINYFSQTTIFVIAENATRSDRRFRGIFKDSVMIQGNEKVKVLLKMKKKTRDRQDLVQTLIVDSYMSIERLGIYAKYLSYEELLEMEEYVEIAEPDEDVYLIDDGNATISASIAVGIRKTWMTPWGIEEVLQDIKFWNSKVPSGDMKICVVDTGYDFGHDDLPRLPDVTGKNTPNITEKWYYDGNGHGTHVAGTVAALGANMKGVRGIFPNNMDGKFQLIIGKAFDSSGKTSFSTVLSAVESCVLKGAKVINLSLGSSNSSETTAAYFHDLYYDEGILIVAAAGNDGDSEYKYPASYPSVISVAAIDRNLSHAEFSNFNDQVELAAPGKKIKSTWRRNEYATISGTSMATPHIAAIAGLLWMHFPKCTNHQIRNVLAKTAMDVSSSGCGNKTGFGLVQSIDAYNLLSKGNCGGYKRRSKNPGGGCNLDSQKVRIVRGRNRMRKKKRKPGR